MVLVVDGGEDKTVSEEGEPGHLSIGIGMGMGSSSGMGSAVGSAVGEG